MTTQSLKHEIVSNLRFRAETWWQSAASLEDNRDHFASIDAQARARETEAIANLILDWDIDR